MKRIFTFLFVGLLFTTSSYGQISEVGVGIGATNFLGDLGKKSSGMNLYFGDIDGSIFRPGASVFYRTSLHNYVAVKVALSYGQFAGDDRLARSQEMMDDDWFRSYRNLSFKSHIVELGVSSEVHIMRYRPGSLKDRMTPYVVGGINALYFNPKAEYNGEWVGLRNLGTEGQGMPGYGKKYSLIQPTITVGIGFKYNINKYIALGVEFGHRITFTDYLDDVSTVYPSEDDIYAYYGIERADLVQGLSVRSGENDPEGEFSYITEEGQYRGNPNGNDAYLMSMLTVTYRFSKNDVDKLYGNPFNKKKRLKRMSNYRRMAR
ncbi:MAG: DUF6089 family protein [Chitinophagales bacterium]